MSAYITQRLKAAWTHVREKRLHEAEEIAVKILKVAPNHADANNLMAAIHFHKNQIPMAVVHSQRAVKAEPNNIAVRQTLVSMLTVAGQRRAALAEIEHLLRMNAGDSELAITHGGTLRDLLKYDEAARIYRAAMQKYPANPLLPSLLAFATNYAPSATPEDVFAAHQEYGAALDRQNPPVTRKHHNTPEPDRTLRVGVLSADLFSHSVGYYLEPILEHANPDRLRFYCYATREAMIDDTTARMRARCAGWQSVVNDSPGQATDKILADRIDVLIELNGLTTTTKALEVMNRAPAPVTVSYLGYPNTTGAKSVAYRLVDSITDPPGSERFAVEELVRLDPCFLCYRPVPAAPDVNPEPPCVRNGFVTFGSFNNMQKLNDRVFETWARIVKGVPRSRLLLKSFRFREPTLHAEVLDRFAAVGLTRDRIDLVEAQPDLSAHLRSYAKLDIALDPFPYNGTTTTCEAMWMGVPTVNVRGDRHAARVGASLLTTVGTPELITADVDAYVALAIELAADPARLAGYRASLRGKIQSSALCDGPGFAIRFEATLRSLWARWCAAPRA